MLYSKEQINNKIDEFKSYCEQQENFKMIKWDSFFTPLYSAVSDYFNSNNEDVSREINFLIQSAYCDILRRSTIYENDYKFDFRLDNNYPYGYNNVEDCFHDFSNIMNTSNETFFNSCTVDITTFSAKSDLMDGWILELQTAHVTDVENVHTLATWCSESGSDLDLVNLLEDRGQIQEIKGTREITKIIYEDRKVLNVIHFFNLSSYIPTYYKGV